MHRTDTTKVVINLLFVIAMILITVGCTAKNTVQRITSTNEIQPANQLSANSNPSTGSNDIAKPASNGKTIYVFSQSDLKLMYVLFYMGQIGPVHPPKDVEAAVWSNGSKVSMDMLKYAPDAEKDLDKQLIQEIINFVTKGHMNHLDHIPGYAYRSFDASLIHELHQTSGSVQRWVPENGQWSNWEGPVIQTE